MMLVSEFVTYLQQEFPSVSFYNGTINKNEPECVGVYATGRIGPRIALGGLENTSYSHLPVSILVHWGKNSDKCQIQANSIYERLFGKSNFYIGDRRIASLQMLDSCPVDIQRDENGICEMVIRLNILYDRR